MARLTSNNVSRALGSGLHKFTGDPILLLVNIAEKNLNPQGLMDESSAARNVIRSDDSVGKKMPAEVAKKILEFKKVNHLPKWLKDLLLTNTDN